MKYYSLKSKKYISINDDNAGLKFLYNNVIGRIFLKITITKFIANIYNKYTSSKLSKNKIKRFIKKNNIDMRRYQEVEYNSFNDFFVRKIKDKELKIEKGLFAIADSKLSVYKINDDSEFKIKNSIYTVSELIGENGQNFKDGYALVFRLCVDDYHRYLYIDSGKFLRKRVIDGKLHTVQPIAFKKHKVFVENSREVTFLDTNTYGNVAYVEVGAMMIGKIVNRDVKEFKRGEEKGHFEFGGSTVVVLFESDQIKINPILLENTEKGIETIVKIGESLND